MHVLSLSYEALNANCFAANEKICNDASPISSISYIIPKVI